MLGVGKIGSGGYRTLRSARALAAREKRRLVAEFVEVRGLMPLLMKPRNRQKWSREDRQLLTQHLKRMSQLSPYLLLLVMPGGLLALPALAWWLDRRRERKGAPAQQADARRKNAKITTLG